MKNYCITFRSVTYGQKGERVLKRLGIDCVLRRTPKTIARKECGYCLQIQPADGLQAVQMLRQSQVQFGSVYGLFNDGGFEELEV